jgi:hypothetical protein
MYNQKSVFHVIRLLETISSPSPEKKWNLPGVTFASPTNDTIDMKDLKFSFGTPYAPASQTSNPFGKLNADYKIREADAIETAIVIQSCLRLADSKKLSKQFPGTHPVNLTLENIDSLQKYPYLVSLKLDGIRYLLYYSNLFRSMYVMDRKLKVWNLSPKRHSTPHSEKESLIDCEILAEEGRIVIIDVININGRNVRGQNLVQRLTQLMNVPFLNNQTIEFQHYYPMSELPNVCNINMTTGKFDGLVFTPAKTSYRLGRNKTLLKWKPPNKNTADFIIRCTAHPNIYGIYSQKTVPSSQGEGREIQHDALNLEGYIECPSNLRLSNNVIAECSYDIHSKAWKVEKTRTDKENANPDWVVQNIVTSIMQNITLETLLVTPFYNRG